MVDFAKKRFDDRIRDREDPGAAFEQFVDEFLRLEAPERRLVRGLARGTDGAIDLSDNGSKLEHIVECKFIGKDTNSTAEDRWREVKGNLSRNLSALAQGDSSGRRKYRPWLRSEGALKTYSFVTSAICPSQDARNQLRDVIQSFFQDQARQHTELSHLAEIKVDLRYWDDLVGQSARFVPLFYRWFGGFPQSYGEISLSFGTGAGFKQFLAGRNLPYFSRAAYLSAMGQEAISDIDTAVESLTQANQPYARVIYGPGGVGKTRLAIEICEKAREFGWWPIRLDRKADVADLDALCQNHAQTGKLLLFIDYAEAFDALEGLPEALVRLTQDGDHRISILASTRSSSLQRVTDRLLGIQTDDAALASSAAEDGYADWVVQNIIAHFSIPDAKEIARSCKGLPVMAAFAGF
ncbi:MAG: ATP-binding protein, partial [Roseomonas sp.]|nr:ATP-binding protein [Roseomonas sp.]